MGEIVKIPEQALPFSPKQLANQIIRQKDRDKSVELINATVRLFAQAAQQGHRFPQLKRHFDSFQNTINRAKIGIRIENSAFEALIKYANPVMHASYYGIPDETANEIDNRNKQ
mgnify:CR=1 FL=1